MPNLTITQVHADATRFESDQSKPEAYAQLLAQAQALLDGQRNWVANCANTASLLWHLFQSLPAPSSAVNWAGFYVLDPAAKGQGLILGPFMGRVACQTIAFGRGVCGTAAAEGRSVLVPDVDAFPGHIACDGDSRSEIVVPIVQDGKVSGFFPLIQWPVRRLTDADRSLLSLTLIARKRMGLMRRIGRG